MRFNAERGHEGEPSPGEMDQAWEWSDVLGPPLPDSGPPLLSALKKDHSRVGAVDADAGTIRA
jgi:hypothetical protein